jgi:hypothetical protein
MYGEPHAPPGRDFDTGRHFPEVGVVSIRAPARRDWRAEPGSIECKLALFKRPKRLRVDDDGLIVMKEAAPQGHRRREDRQNGDQTLTHTHTSPLRTQYALHTYLQPPLNAHFQRKLVAELPQLSRMIPR